MTSVVLHTAALLGYLAAAVLYGANLALRAPRPYGAARLLLLGSIALHTAAIGAHCVLTHTSPFASAFGTLSIGAWAVALVFVPVESLTRLPALGALAAPVCCVLLFAALVRSQSTVRVEPQVRTGIISIHVLLVLFSFALFALAACCAVFYVWQYGLLKHRDRRGLFRRLPPLETVDAAAFRLVAFALPLLTLGLALGIVRAVAGDLPGNWATDPHTLISIAAWLVYGAYLLARSVGGWRGTRPNYLLIAGLVVTLTLYFVPSTAHRFT